MLLYNVNSYIRRADLFPSAYPKGDTDLEDQKNMNEKNVAARPSRALPDVKELRAALAASEQSDTRKMIAALFDDATFSEIGVYTKRSFSEFAVTGETNDFEGVICGYGAVEGRLVYAFGQDLSRMDGAMDEKHAKKIVALYEMAEKNGAPIVGIFNSTGANVYEGVSSLAAYGHIMRAVAELSGKVPQIAVIAGDCTGCAAPLASMFDFIVSVRDASFYVHTSDFEDQSEGNEPTSAFIAKDGADAMRDVRILLSYLPSFAGAGTLSDHPSDSPNRLLGTIDFGADVRNVVAALADNGVFDEITRTYAPEMFTAFTTLGGVRCGVLGNRSLGGIATIGVREAKKAARFFSFCDAFSIPVLTLVDTDGFSFYDDVNQEPYASALASLAFAYAKSKTAKVTVVLGRAVGGAFTIFGSKSIGVDVVYALADAEIGVLPTDAAVAFAWNDLVSENISRGELEEEWRTSLASPVAAACRGEIDDIISIDEMRQKVLSAIYMLAAKNTHIDKRHPILPL